MTPQAIYSEFKNAFGYLEHNVTKFTTIKNDPRSLRIYMRDGTVYIFTYPPNGHYTLVTERLGKILQEEREWYLTLYLVF